MAHQRPAFTATSPPLLHHPVPQHPIPQHTMRSPPPLSQTSSGSAYASSPYQQQTGVPIHNQGHSIHPAYGGFLAEPAAQIGLQMGASAMRNIEQNMNRYVNYSALKHYFNVSNSYVLNKLRLVIFPWRHRPWTRIPKAVGPSQADGMFLPPRDDLNSPDMYIPVMAFVTYILLYTMLAGIRGHFHPELLGKLASTAFAIVLLEILGLKFGCYLLNINNESQLLDLVAYSGYKFVGIIATILIQELSSNGWLRFLGFFYFFSSNAFFLLRSLKYVLLPETSTDNPRGTVQAVARAQRNRRTQFLFIYSYVVQFVFMWILTTG
ncbi:hypothetical protein TWF225_002246 [Orbilia oligospora]|uniref:Protein YIF1 n=1 Tax=Orbilia oligospora TaxID=2813651 RepID=A0A7C8PQ56_ORBOL|nr:hypothetical protein TWF751_006342 [Orbilia oligospora]KAF3190497.1 hypothetical protein TWF225_002246 [Orbilia oligospora]KAF3236387.1 hypothetical protein TWF128_001395 [Orbilia oligospora]KAF3242182.1 hypothetical protein TWF217_011827 [Orbilia oligospora]KAF3280398.1 hypothetical protein TWF132_011766 [Orbilia oligospora]